MKTKLVKIIKKEQRNASKRQPAVEDAANPKEWSTAVKSWVTDFENERRDKSPTAFDSLFEHS